MKMRNLLPILILVTLPLLAAHHLLSRLKSRWVNHLERALSLIAITARATSAKAGERGKSLQKVRPGTRHET